MERQRRQAALFDFDVIFPVMAGTTVETLFLSRWLRAIYCWDDG